MIITYLQIINLPVVQVNEQEKIGNITEIVYQKNDFAICAFLLQKQFLDLSLNQTVIHQSDVLSVDTTHLSIATEKNISTLKEMSRVQKLYKDHFHGIGQRAYDESGKYYGKVIDIHFDSNTLAITKFLLKGLFQEQLVAPNSITKWTGKKIIIRNEQTSEKVQSFVKKGIIEQETISL
jgi:uncharacterized protein YrrD